jgi:hypothetical protein
MRNGRNVGGFNIEPLAAGAGCAELGLQIPLELEVFRRLDPPQQAQLQRIAGLEIALACLNVLRNPDLDRGASIFILAKETRHGKPRLHSPSRGVAGQAVPELYPTAISDGRARPTRSEAAPQLGVIALTPKAFTAWRMLKARIESAASAFTALIPNCADVDSLGLEKTAPFQAHACSQ